MEPPTIKCFEPTTPIVKRVVKLKQALNAGSQMLKTAENVFELGSSGWPGQPVHGLVRKGSFSNPTLITQFGSFLNDDTIWPLAEMVSSPVRSVLLNPQEQLAPRNGLELEKKPVHTMGNLNTVLCLLEAELPHTKIR